MIVSYSPSFLILVQPYNILSLPNLSSNCSYPEITFFTSTSFVLKPKKHLRGFDRELSRIGVRSTPRTVEGITFHLGGIPSGYRPRRNWRKKARIRESGRKSPGNRSRRDWLVSWSYFNKCSNYSKKVIKF